MDPHEFVGHGDVVEGGGFLVGEEEVRGPHVLHGLGRKHETRVKLVEHHPVVGPDLAHVDVHRVILKAKIEISQSILFPKKFLQS